MDTSKRKKRRNRDNYKNGVRLLEPPIVDNGSSHSSHVIVDILSKKNTVEFLSRKFTIRQKILAIENLSRKTSMTIMSKRAHLADFNTLK